MSKRQLLQVTSGLAGVGLCAGLALIAWHTVTVPWVEGKLSARLGHAVHIGALHTRGFGLRAENVRVFGGPPFEHEVLARIERADISFGNLGWHPVVTAVAVDGADVELLFAGLVSNLRSRRSAGVPATGSSRAARVAPSISIRNLRLRGLAQLPDGHRIALRTARVSLERPAGAATTARIEGLALDVHGVGTMTLPALTIEEVAATGAVILQGTDAALGLPGAAPLLAGLSVEGAWNGASLDVALLHTGAGDDDTGPRLRAAVHLAGSGLRVDVEGRELPLAGLSPLFDGRGVDVARSHADVTVQASWAPGIDHLPVAVSLAARHLQIRHPAIDSEGWDDVPLAVDFKGQVDLGLSRLDIELGHARVLGLALDLSGWTELGPRPRGTVRVATSEGGVDCARLPAEQPLPVQRALWGLKLGGRLAAAAALTFDAAAWDTLGLEMDVKRLCTVTAEPADLARLALALKTGRPPGDAQARALPLGPYNPRFVPFNRMPKHLVAAFVTAEDNMFFAHRGFHIDGIRRALAHDLEVGTFARGASTITQQLAKNLFLNQERTVARKLEETVLTWRLDALLPKQRILELYLNIIEMGPNIRGVPAAAHAYFGKAPALLTPLESAHLASLTPNPVGFARRFREGRVDEGWLHRLYDLLGMMKRGGHITPVDLANARAGKLQLRRI